MYFKLQTTRTAIT